MTPWPTSWPSLEALHRMARGVIQSDDGAEHVLGHAIVRALEKPPTFDENVQGWFRRTMRRASIDWMRRYSGRVSDVEPEDDEFRADGPLDPESIRTELDRVELREVVEFLHSQIDALAPQEQEIVRLIYWDGLTASAVARRLDVSRKTVVRCKSRALDSMRRQVAADPARHGRSLLALAGVPSSVWSRQGAGATSTLTSASVLVASFVCVAGLLFLALNGILRAGPAAASATSADLAATDSPNASDATDLSVIDAGESSGARAAVDLGRVEIAPDEAAVALAAEARMDEGEVSAVEPRQFLELTVSSHGVPWAGLEGWAYTVDGEGLPRMEKGELGGAEEVRPGVYRFDVPVRPESWRFILEDSTGPLSLLLQRQLSDVPLAEAISLDFEFGPRSFRVPGFELTDRYPSNLVDPWWVVEGVMQVQPATWLRVPPIKHGGTVIDGRYERAFDGELHFARAPAFGFELRHVQTGVEPIAWRPIVGVSEIPTPQ